MDDFDLPAEHLNNDYHLKTLSIIIGYDCNPDAFSIRPTIKESSLIVPHRSYLIGQLVLRLCIYCDRDDRGPTRDDRIPVFPVGSFLCSWDI
jgi:hypothetical protein